MCTSYLLNANSCNNSVFLAVDKAVITSEVFCTCKEMEKVETFLTFLLPVRTDDLWKEGSTSFKSVPRCGWPCAGHSWFQPALQWTHCRTQLSSSVKLVAPL